MTRFSLFTQHGFQRALKSSVLRVQLIANVCIALASVAVSSSELVRHAGPVSDILVHQGNVYSVSQSGIFKGVNEERKLWFRPSFRATSMGAQGSLFFVGGGDPGLAGWIAVVDLEGDQIRMLRVADDLVYDVSVHPGGKLAAFACADNRVMTVSFPELKESSLREWHRHTAAARAVAFSPNGSHLASGGLDALVMLSDLDGEGTPIQIQDHSGKVESLVFSTDSELVASGARDSKVRLHNMSGRLVRTYSRIAEPKGYGSWGKDGAIWSLAWGQDSNGLVAGSSTGGVFRLSTLDSQSELRMEIPEQPIYSLAFGPEGSLLIGTFDLTERAL
jgi:WD40 repeat protein